MRIWAWLVLLGGCGRVGFDATADARDAHAELPPWSPAQRVMELSGLDDVTLTGDMLEMYVNVASTDIFMTKRNAIGELWSMPALVPELDTAANNATPHVSSDGLTIYFASSRTPTVGGNDIWVATRLSRTLPWDTPVHVPELSSTLGDHGTATSEDQLATVLDSKRASSGSDDDLFMATRSSATAPWDPPVALGALNVPGFDDESPILSGDKLTIYFDSNRGGSYDLYRSGRGSITEEFPAPTLIEELSTTGQNEADPWISVDERHIFFVSSGVWESSR